MSPSPRRAGPELPSLFGLARGLPVVLGLFAAACQPLPLQGRATRDPAVSQGAMARAVEGREASAADAASDPVARTGGASPATPADDGAEARAKADAAAAAASVVSPTLSTLRREANRVVDDWHAAAATCDSTRYLGYLADDVVFLGTDATERWDLAQFRTYVEHYMSRGKCWVYVPSERGLMLSEGADFAWFDERLANETYGQLRGTGVLRRHGDSWLIVHYSMTLTIPNELTRDVAGLIRER